MRPRREYVYRSTGLAWCDKLVSLQHDADTHDGRKGVAGWWDTGYSELYIADTGTAVTCLALCYDIDPQPRYMRSMLKFAEFVVNGTRTTPRCTFKKQGCDYDPAGNDTETTATWLVGDGSLGDGYYKGRLNLPSYTIATATTGGAFAEMYALTRGERADFADMARDASAWLIRHVQQNGTIPYYIYPPTTVPHEYQCISYSAEAIIDADLRGLLNHTDVLKPAKRIIEYLLEQQQPSGELLNPAVASFGEQQRSPRAMSILQWYAERTGDAAARDALQKYTGFLQRNWQAYGVNSYALITGFVGLGLADLIEPWSSFTGSSLTLKHDHSRPIVCRVLSSYY